MIIIFIIIRIKIDRYGWLSKIYVVNTEFPARQTRDSSNSDLSHPMTLRKRMHRWYRKGIYQRFNLVFEHAGDLSAKTVLLAGNELDGYLPALVKAGAQQVLVIEGSSDESGRLMETIHEYGLEDSCAVRHGDLNTLPMSGQRFDICLAMGAFDDLSDPKPLLARLMALSEQRVMANFLSRGKLGSAWRRARHAVSAPEPLLLTRRDLGLIACSLDPSSVQILDMVSGGLFLIMDI